MYTSPGNERLRVRGERARVGGYIVLVLSCYISKCGYFVCLLSSFLYLMVRV